MNDGFHQSEFRARGLRANTSDLTLGKHPHQALTMLTPDCSKRQGTGSIYKAMATPMLIHIGLHKTGTSYLQRLIFDDVRAGFRSPVPRLLLRETFVTSDAFSFEPELARSHLSKFLTSNHPEETVTVLSHEQFSGQPAGGGYGLRRREREVGRKELADRLYDTFPDARILMVIREQRAMLRSIYKWMVCGWEGRLSATPRQFLDQSPLMDGYSPLFNGKYLEYHHLVQYYQQRFGTTNVLVLPYEWLAENRVDFVNQIRTFVGLRTITSAPEARVNPGSPATLCAIQRNLNRLLASPNRPGRRSLPERYAAALARRTGALLPRHLNALVENRLVEQFEAWAEERYALSNRKTTEITGLDLPSLGYVVPDMPKDLST